MRTTRHAGTRKRGFTLIEMLMVIFIIALVAGMVIGVFALAGDNAKRKRVEAQLKQLEVAIERYHSKHGVYPPDNPANPNINQLFYELTGVVVSSDGSTFTDYEGNTFNPSVFGVGGIVHSDTKRPKNFLGDQVKTVDIGGARMLSVPVDWPEGFPNPPIPAKPTVNVWRYNSSNPRHNKNSYDLWAEVVLGGKLVTIANWNRAN